MEPERSLDHKIWGIAWPAILSNISIPLLGLVDAAILGHLDSTAYLGAVAIGGALLSFLYWGFNFLRMGTTGLVAKATGAGRPDQALLILARSAVLAVALAATVLCLHPLVFAVGFNIMSPGPESLALAESYASIRILSAPAVLLTYTVVGWFIGRQNTRWPMLILIATNTINIALDFLFIVGLDMNSDGAAIATVLAEYLGCGLALLAVWRQSSVRLNTHMYQQLLQWEAYRTLLRSNRHLFVRTMLLLASLAFFTAMGDKFGSETLAANALLMQLVMLAAFGMDGFAFAAEGLAGHRLGAGDLPGFYSAVRRCALWTLLCAALVSLLFLVSHSLIFTLLTSLPEVRRLLSEYYPWVVLLPLVSAPGYLLDGVFIGAAETRYMMTTMVFSALVVYLPLWYLTQAWGNHGLWFAFTALNAARGAGLYGYYRKLSKREAWI